MTSQRRLPVRGRLVDGVQVSARGVALVEAVIQAVTAGESTEDLAVAEPDPVPADVLDGFRLPGGVSLPPSLRRWLAFDRSWLESSVTDYTLFADGQLRTCTIAEAVRDLIGDEDMARDCEELAVYGETPVLPVSFGGSGCESLEFLLLADPDRHGEYPVLYVDTDPGYAEIGAVAVGFDVYLATRAGLVADSETGYPDDHAGLLQRVFAGRDSLIAGASQDEDG
jgi:hypothetical protein